MHLKNLPFLFLFILLPFSAFAGNLSVLSSNGLPVAEVLNGGCSILLEGEIQDGDSENIDALFDWDSGPLEGIAITGFIEDGYLHEEERAHALCLNSNGGDFDEALEILESEAFTLYRVVTVVPENATCLSACALVFLGGTYSTSNSDGGNTIPLRVMHATARIGLHSPIVADVDKLPEVLPREAVVDFFAAGTEAVRRLNDIFTNGYVDTHSQVDRFPSDLLIELLSFRDVDKFYEINNVNDAGRLDIYLAGAPKVEFSDRSYARLCVNASIWSIARMSNDSPDIVSWGYTVSMQNNQISVSSRHYECEIHYRGEVVGDDFEVVFSNRQYVEQTRYMEAWESLPHYTPLNLLEKIESVEGEFDPDFVYINEFEAGGEKALPIFSTPSIYFVRTDGGETGFGSFRLSLYEDNTFEIDGVGIGMSRGTYQVKSQVDLCLNLTHSDIERIHGTQVCGSIWEDQLKFSGIAELSGLVEFQRGIF